ncbi:hypothetical protein THAOC_02203 [Thalassiosira oceanica]|uniref:TauD/TfdA-like domain-containing protein n=1 Tax=Thalassiosira oceanica TaxID=159749 RepID=K0TQH4_THAOC|nr:hypothetical protein THAOC_02203 [Thalassiosira oceanica]|eukprot:EJK76052.1 hypothetical protein THAOC_02203 [Thalassiosira oceanica]
MMRIAALATVVGGASAFAPSQLVRRTAASALHSTLEREETAPTRVAPDAGWEPEWEGRTGLSPDEFMKSDMDSDDLSGMWECPLTRWDSEGIDVEKAQAEGAKQPHCPLEMKASDADNAMGAEYFSKNKEQIRADLLKYGAIWFRGFDLMKSVSGNREMHEALGLDPCPRPPPLLRSATAKRTAAYAAFVCFQRATEGGGRFLVADGAAILGELSPELAKKLYERKIRISVSNLDIPPSFPGPIKEGIKGLVDAAVAPKFDMDLEMIYEADGKPGETPGGRDGRKPDQQASRHRHACLV